MNVQQMYLLLPVVAYHSYLEPSFSVLKKDSKRSILTRSYTIHSRKPSLFRFEQTTVARLQLGICVVGSGKVICPNTIDFIFERIRYGQ